MKREEMYGFDFRPTLSPLSDDAFERLKSIIEDPTRWEPLYELASARRGRDGTARGSIGSYDSNNDATFSFPEEVAEPELLYEGAVYQVSVNAYERNPEARRKCIEYYGASCFVCKFNFGEVYGEAGEGFIHVHHLRPLAQVGEEYQVDPVADLRPVCPNCHAIIHRRNPAYSIEEVKTLLSHSGR